MRRRRRAALWVRANWVRCSASSVWLWPPHTPLDEDAGLLIANFRQATIAGQDRHSVLARVTAALESDVQSAASGWVVHRDSSNTARGCVDRMSMALDRPGVRTGSGLNQVAAVAMVWLIWRRTSRRQPRQRVSREPIADLRRVPSSSAIFRVVARLWCWRQRGHVT